MFKNKWNIICSFSSYTKILKNNPKILRINPKRKKVPKIIKETPIIFQQKLEILLNKNSPLSAYLSFSLSWKFRFSHSKNEFYATSLPCNILKYKGLLK